MYKTISSKISKKFQQYNIVKIESGASRKKIYRLENKKNSLILIDFSKDKDEFNNHLKIYELTQDANISLPKIEDKYEDHLILITEDFGDLRYDKILKKYSIKDLFHYAVDTLIILQNSIKYKNKFILPKYNFENFINEISELPNYYFPYIGLNEKGLVDEFIFTWTEAFNNIDFQFNKFVHKDFNVNNLIFLPDREDHLKCGIIDFQNAFWGENSWDLFSLLEDSRILFTDEFNEYFINYFHKKTNINIPIDQFKNKYYFLNSSRQSRLLGRWIKLKKELNQDWYLDFIKVTKIRLEKSLNMLDDKNLKNLYNKYIFN